MLFCFQVSGYEHQFHRIKFSVYEEKESNFWHNSRHYICNMDDVTTPVHATTKWTKMGMHCRTICGSLDRWKHLCIKCVPKTGSLYFNYKGYFLVLLLLSSANIDG
jgi:hypothetical protein